MVMMIGWPSWPLMVVCVCVCVGVSNNEYLSKRINTLWLFSTTGTGQVEGLDVGGSRLIAGFQSSVGFARRYSLSLVVQSFEERWMLLFNGVLINVS